MTLKGGDRFYKWQRQANKLKGIDMNEQYLKDQKAKFYQLYQDEIEKGDIKSGEKAFKEYENYKQMLEDWQRDK